MTIRPSFLLLLLVSGVACSRGQLPTTETGAAQNTYADPRAAAEHELDTLRKVVNENNFKDFGLESADELKDASVGSPTKIFLIPDAKLAAYTKGTDVRSLLQDDHRTMFPLVVGGKARTVITVAQTDHGWKFAAYGQTALAQNLSEIKASKAGSPGSGPGAAQDEYYDVRIQGMGLDFLALNGTTNGPGASSDVMLTPLAEPVPQPLVEPLSGPGAHVLRKKGKTAGASDYFVYKSDYLRTLGSEPSTHKLADLLRENPSFSPQGEGSKSAADVFEALAPAAKAMQQGNGPQ